MAHRRHLSELFLVGRELIIEDELGPEMVWIQKLNQIQHAEVIRKADAKKARTLTIKRFPDGDAWQAIMAAVYDLGDKDALVGFMVAQHEAKIRYKRESEVAFEEEWKKDGYLQTLRDAWFGSEDAPGLQYAYAENPEDMEALRVFTEMQRFDEAVRSQIMQELEVVKGDYENYTVEALQDKVAEAYLDLQANAVWINEFYYFQILYSTRFPDNHKERYFGSREELDELPNEVYTALRDAIDHLTMDILEGKELPGVPDSSISSEAPSEAETSLSSGPEVVRV